MRQSVSDERVATLVPAGARRHERLSTRGISVTGLRRNQSPAATAPHLLVVAADPELENVHIV